MHHPDFMIYVPYLNVSKEKCISSYSGMIIMHGQKLSDANIGSRYVLITFTLHLSNLQVFNEPDTLPLIYFIQMYPIY